MKYAEDVLAAYKLDILPGQSLCQIVANRRA